MSDAPDSTASDTTAPDNTAPADTAPGHDDDQDYVDRSAVDFDPDDGYYSGTAVDGTSEIPNPADAAAGESAEDAPADTHRPRPGPGDTTD